MDKYVVWAMIIGISLVGAVGNILFKIGTNRWGAIPPGRFLDISFFFEYLFTPAIFAALVLLFLARFLIGSPLSVSGATETIFVITLLSLIFTLIFETVFLKVVYNLWTYAGIAIGLVSLALIARGMNPS